ncbi:hypothetical protein QE152_g25754 [Popillia japonica]|uniref:Uncharacterized protein n=1 Tax=Popillia japonica TaxID=7064 RepID=A0AAW1K0K7_POPJA
MLEPVQQKEMPKLENDFNTIVREPSRLRLGFKFQSLTAADDFILKTGLDVRCIYTSLRRRTPQAAFLKLKEYVPGMNILVYCVWRSAAVLG